MEGPVDKNLPNIFQFHVWSTRDIQQIVVYDVWQLILFLFELVFSLGENHCCHTLHSKLFYSVILLKLNIKSDFEIEYPQLYTD